MDIRIVADGDGQFNEYQGRTVRGVVKAIGALHGGMASGEASVAIFVELEDGRVVMSEMSMRHFFAAKTVFEAHYTPAERGGFI